MVVASLASFAGADPVWRQYFLDTQQHDERGCGRARRPERVVTPLEGHLDDRIPETEAALARHGPGAVAGVHSDRRSGMAAAGCLPVLVLILGGAEFWGRPEL
jgi:hypothetical protein